MGGLQSSSTMHTSLQEVLLAILNLPPAISRQLLLHLTIRTAAVNITYNSFLIVGSTLVDSLDCSSCLRSLFGLTCCYACPQGVQSFLMASRSDTLAAPPHMSASHALLLPLAELCLDMILVSVQLRALPFDVVVC